MAADVAGLNERVAALLNEVRSRANEVQEAGIVAAINAEVELWGSHETTVVVVGEANRGKTSLVNALLGTSDVLPVGGRVHTTIYVVLRYAAEPCALVHLDGRLEPVRVEMHDVAQWIVNDGGDGGRVRGVELRLPHPLLESGLVVVDTPGVGGLASAHGRVTLAALRRADALLFVTDADAPIGAPELAFLEQATARVAIVLFALTKIDAYRGWRRVLEDDQRLIAEHAPALARRTFVPTSARLHEADLADESGIPELAAALRDNVAARTANVRLANLLRVGEAALATLEYAPRSAVEATKGEPEAQAVIERDQTALDELRDAAERAQQTISDQFNVLRDQLTTELNRRLRTITDGIDADPKSARRDADQLLSGLESELEALDLELGEMIESNARRILEDATTRLGIGALDVTISARAGIDDVALDARPTGSGDSDPTARLRIATALTSAGTSIGIATNYAHGQMAWLAPIMGLSVVVGLTSTFVGARVGRRQRDLQAVRAAMRSAVEQCRAEAGPRLRQAVVEVQREVEGAVRSVVRHETRSRQQSIGQAQQALRADATARQRLRAEAEQRLAVLAQLRVRLDAMKNEVDATLH